MGNSILYITNISNGVSSFSITAVKAAKKIGFEFHLAGNFSGTTNEKLKSDEETYGIKIHQIDLDRSPYSKNNFKAFMQLVHLIQHEKIDYIHCNTPIGGILGRLAGEKCGVKKIVYQVHGFHFYNGAPIKNWILYYSVEKWLAKKTDAIITINREDFAAAQKFKLKNNGKVFFVPGVGIDLSRYNFSKKIREEKRKELGLDETSVMLISMGDLINRKNYKVAIEAIGKVNNQNIHYFICGEGPEESRLKLLTKNLTTNSHIYFLGFRNDINELLAAADIFLFTTKQEGLPRSMMEAMAYGLPCIASRIRGNTDLIIDGNGGYLKDTNDVSGFVKAIELLAYNKNLRNQMRNTNLKNIQKYDTDIIKQELEKIYLEIIGE